MFIVGKKVSMTVEGSEQNNKFISSMIIGQLSIFTFAMRELFFIIQCIVCAFPMTIVTGKLKSSLVREMIFSQTPRHNQTSSNLFIDLGILQTTLPIEFLISFRRGRTIFWSHTVYTHNVLEQARFKKSHTIKTRRKRMVSVILPLRNQL